MDRVTMARGKVQRSQGEPATYASVYKSGQELSTAIHTCSVCAWCRGSSSTLSDALQGSVGAWLHCRLQREINLELADWFAPAK